MMDLVKVPKTVTLSVAYIKRAHSLGLRQVIRVGPCFKRTQLLLIINAVMSMSLYWFIRDALLKTATETVTAAGFSLVAAIQTVGTRPIRLIGV